MTPADVKKTAFAMPLTAPTYPRGPYRFIDREYMIITYRTDLAALRAVVPEPLEIGDPLVKYEFIRMPNSTGFGNYTESGQVIPVTYKGKSGGFVHSMYLDDDAPIAGGREIWGFPKKLAQPSLNADKDVLLGTLDYGARRHGHNGLQTHHARQRQSQSRDAGTEFPAQDHSARRLHAPHLRTGPLQPRGHHDQRRVEFTRRA
jgi:acetoacetate decarboxylase